jgi:hypothetical protein
MSAEEADALDRRIHQAIEDTWTLLVEMNDRRGWDALGYSTMASYLMETLDVKTSQAYRIISRVDAVKAIAEAVGDTSPKAQAEIAKAVSAKAAEGIKPVLDEVAEEVAEAVAAGKPLGKAAKDAVRANRTDRKPAPDPDEDAAGDAGLPGVTADDPLLAGLGPGELAALGLDSEYEPSAADTGDNDRPARPRDPGTRDAPITGGPLGGGRVQYVETDDEAVYSGDGMAAAHAAAAAQPGRKTMPWESGYEDGHDGGEDISRIMSEAPGHERTGRQRSVVPRPLPPRPGRKTCPTCSGHADVIDNE